MAAVVVVAAILILAVTMWLSTSASSSSSSLCGTVAIALCSSAIIVTASVRIPVVRRVIAHAYLHLVVHPFTLAPAARRIDKEMEQYASASPVAPYHARMPTLEALFSLESAGGGGSAGASGTGGNPALGGNSRGSLADRAARLRALLVAHHGLPRPAERGDTTGNVSGSHGTPGLATLLSRCPLYVRRGDGCFASLAPQLAAATPRQLAAGLNVRFEGEPALDAGGVTRELFSTLSARGVDPSVLHEMADGSVYVRPRGGGGGGGGRPTPLFYYEALGRLLGCAIAQAALDENGVTCPLPLSSALRKMAVDEMMRAADVRASDPLMYRLRVDALLEPDGVSNVAAALCEEQLTFVSDDDPPVELCEGGAARVVDEHNVNEYVCRLSEHLLCAGQRAELHAALRGLWSVVPLAALVESHIDSFDLGALLAGAPELDVDEWEAHTLVEASADVGAARAEACRASFFRVLRHRLDGEMRSRVFAFATGLHRLPATGGGFARLAPPFTLQVLGPSFAGRLPVAHTCFNALQLAPPAASSAGAGAGAGAAGLVGDDDDDAQLARVLTTAVHFGGEGFGLV